MENRVIKFRAWDKETKKYVVGSQTIGNILYEVIHNPNTDVLQFYEIEQFTGLHDRDGKEVYEGDRLSAGGGSLFYEVVFQDGGFCFKNELSSGPDRLSKDRVARLSIIGHIHETN